MVVSAVMLLPQAGLQQTSLSMHQPDRLVVLVLVRLQEVDTETDTVAVRIMFLLAVGGRHLPLGLSLLRHDKTTPNGVDMTIDDGTTTEIIGVMVVEKGVIGMEMTEGLVIVGNMRRVVEVVGGVMKMIAVRNDVSIEGAPKGFGRIR